MDGVLELELERVTSRRIIPAHFFSYVTLITRFIVRNAADNDPKRKGQEYQKVFRWLVGGGDLIHRIRSADNETGKLLDTTPIGSARSQ